jgi:hypothetical protein
MKTLKDTAGGVYGDYKHIIDDVAENTAFFLSLITLVFIELFSDFLSQYSIMLGIGAVIV